MSVKIYDGWMIPRDLGLPELRKFAIKLRPKLEAMVEAEQLTALAHVVSRSFDSAYLGVAAQEEANDKGDDPGEITARGAGWRWLADMRERDKRGERVHVPMSFEAIFFAVGGGKTLAMAFGGRKLSDVFAKHVGAVEYGYWNTTDKPEEVGYREWSQRKRDWQKALGKGFELSPAEGGVGVKLVSEKYSQWWFPEPEEIAARLAQDDFSANERAKRMASKLLSSQYFDKALRQHPEIFDAGKMSASLSGFVNLDRQWREYAKTPEGEASMKLCEGLIAAGLPKINVSALEVKACDVSKMGMALSAAVRDRLALDITPKAQPKSYAVKRTL